MVRRKKKIEKEKTYLDPYDRKKVYTVPCNKVDTRPLLPCLECATKVGLASLDRTAQDAEPRAALLCLRLLVQLVNNDGNVLLDVNFRSAQPLQCVRAVVYAAVGGQPARRLRAKEQQAAGQQQWEDVLHGHGDAEAARIYAVLGGVVDAHTQNQPNADVELVHRNDGATDARRCAVGNVQRNKVGDEADGVT